MSKPTQKEIIEDQEKGNARIVAAAEKLREADAYEVVDVQIDEYGLLPPKYFMYPDVLELVRRRVRDDVVAHGERLPAGCRAQYAVRGSMAAATAKLDAAKRDASQAILQVIKDNLALIIVLYGLASMAVLIFLIVKGVN